MRIRQKRLVHLLSSIPVVILFTELMFVCLQLRQAELNQALISAIRNREDQASIALLDQGASGTAVDRTGTPVTFETRIAEIWDRIQGRNKGTEGGASAIMLTRETQDSQRTFLSGGEVLICPVTKADPSLLRALLKHQADPNSWDRIGGDSALQTQIRAKNLVAVKMLLESGANPNVDNSGSALPPLILAVMNNQTEIVECLLDHSADTQVLGHNGQTVLHYAAMLKNAPLIDLLLSHYADINARDRDGCTPLMFATSLPDDWVRLLLHRGRA